MKNLLKILWNRVVSYSKLLWCYTRSFWWIGLLVICVIFVVGFYKIKKKEKNENGEIIDEGTSVIDLVQFRAQDAITDIRVERAVIASETIAKKEELEDIKKEPDGVVRRKRLAKLLQKSL